MTMDLTHNILQAMKGHLDITVTVPHVAGRLIVKGACFDGQDAPWQFMPAEMRVNRTVYCCRPAWDEAAPAVFVFADDVTVVDAPAYLVVDQMMERMREVGVSGEDLLREGEFTSEDEE